MRSGEARVIEVISMARVIELLNTFAVQHKCSHASNANILSKRCTSFFSGENIENSQCKADNATGANLTVAKPFDWHPRNEADEFPTIRF